MWMLQRLMHEHHQDAVDIKTTATGIHSRLDQHEERMTRQEEAMAGHFQTMEQQLDQRLRQEADDHQRQLDTLMARFEELAGRQQHQPQATTTSIG